MLAKAGIHVNGEVQIVRFCLSVLKGRFAMFCKECGAQLLNGAKFCSNCGTPIHQKETQKANQKTKATSSGMVAIVCELCGSNELAKENGFFVCQHCGTKYSLEEARKLLNDGVVRLDQSGQVDNLLKRAREFENKKERAKAIDYYNRVLDIDSENKKARAGINKIEQNYGPSVNNVFIELCLDSKSGRHNVYIDGVSVGVLRKKYNGMAIRLDVGSHTLTIVDGVTDLNDTHTCVRFRVDDQYSRVKIEVLSKMLSWPKYKVYYL